MSNDDKDFRLQVAACLGGPVLLYFLTRLLDHLISPQAPAAESRLPAMLWAAFCGAGLGGFTLELCFGKDVLSERVNNVKSFVATFAFLTCSYIWGRRDQFIEIIPGPILIFLWCSILVGLGIRMQKETSRNRLLGWQEPAAIRFSTLDRDGDFYRSAKRGIVTDITLILFLVGGFVFAPQLLQSLWFILVYSIALSLNFRYVVPLLLLCHFGTGQRYEINAEGLVSQDTFSRHEYRWSDIVRYSVGDNKGVDGMRWLHFQATRREKIEDRLFSFDPQEVEENKVRQILHQYLDPSRRVRDAYPHNFIEVGLLNEAGTINDSFPEHKQSANAGY